MTDFVVTEEHAVGDHMEFNWNHFLNPEASPFWYECIITANHGESVYDIELIENHVLNDPVMLYTKDGRPLVIGSVVSYNWRYTGDWYDYVVTKINEDRTVNLALEVLSVSSEFLRKPFEQEQYAINETVEYNWGGGCNWFDGTVISVHPTTNTYDIALVDEGVSIAHLSLSTRLPPTEPRPSFSMVTPGSLYEGQLVEYNWQGSGYWYLNYMVLRVLSDTTCDVQLIDRDICSSALRHKTTSVTVQPQAAVEMSSLESEQAQEGETIVETTATSIPIATVVRLFVVGDVIQHNWNEGGIWWDNYRITAVHNEDTTTPRYDLIYTDGTEVHNVSAMLIRHPEVAVAIATTSTTDVPTDATTEAMVARECCYCHQSSAQGIIISHGDFLCVECQHNSPLSVYYTNSR